MEDENRAESGNLSVSDRLRTITMGIGEQNTELRRIADALESLLEGNE